MVKLYFVSGFLWNLNILKTLDLYFNAMCIKVLKARGLSSKKCKNCGKSAKILLKTFFVAKSLLY
jgi:hypothetical protein